MSKLSKLAKSIIGGCEIMENREKSEQIMDEVVTITDMDILTGDKGNYAVYTLKEYPKNYFFGGKSLTLIAEEVKADSELMNELHTVGLRVSLKKVKTKKGNDFTQVELYD